MGYSSRYHVASLVAVFVALAIGILIGAALGSDVVSGTAESLEEQLSEDLDQVRAENADLREQLEFERGFAGQIAPALVADRLAGQEVALIGLGDADTAALAEDIEAALDPSGARLTQVGNLRVPPDAAALVDALAPGRERPDPAAVELAGRRVARMLARPGELDAGLRGTLFSRFSGDSARLEAVVLARGAPPDLDEREAERAAALERGLADGLAAEGVRVAGAERTDADPSSIDHLAGLGAATVDNVDQLAGRVALVLALEGANGTFGTKESADSLLPELIGPPR